MSLPTCYLISGFLGAGKTTYSQKLSKETGAIHLNPDEWCMKLFSKEEYEQNWSKCFSETIEHLWKKAEEYAKNKKSVIFDMGFWTKLSRDEATQRAKDLGFNPVIHFLNVPDEILKQRISAREGTIAEYNLKHFDELKKQFEVPTKTEKYVKYDNY
ncbi:MAG: ATP-binding protein [Alphaproteobacteria bacterium]|nr:ATP-binding protein [Alphaproteobacteria bacterium]